MSDREKRIAMLDQWWEDCEAENCDGDEWPARDVYRRLLRRAERIVGAVSDELDLFRSRCHTLRLSRTPTDSAVPEPAKHDNACQSSTTEGPKVVGYDEDDPSLPRHTAGVLRLLRHGFKPNWPVTADELEREVRSLKDEAERLKTENYRLEQDRDASEALRRIERDSFASEKAGLDAENERLTEEKDRWEREAERLKTENDMLNRERAGEVWCWQGDEYDHPESLACPVLIGPDDLRAILAENERLTKSRDALLELEQELLKQIRLITEHRDRLKAENERLQGDLDDHGAEIRVLQEGWAAHEAAADESYAEIQKLKAQRDAYADPKNWQVQGEVRGSGDHPPYRLTATFVGPTPADPEPESVEGEVTTSWSTGDRVSIDAFGASWPEGTPVKITRLPETGGNDGD